MLKPVNYRWNESLKAGFKKFSCDIFLLISGTAEACDL